MMTFSQARREFLAQQLLPSSAIMTGLCLVTIGLVKVREGYLENTIIDEMLAADSLLFCVSLLFSFSAIYMSGRKGAVEDGIVATALFITGVLMVVITCFLFALDLG